MGAGNETEGSPSLTSLQLTQKPAAAVPEPSKTQKEVPCVF